MLSSIFSIISLAAAADAFGLVTIHSGSDVQYAEVKLSSDGHLSLNGETAIDFTLDGDKLYANGNGVSLYQGAPIVTPGVIDSLWSVADGHLQLQDSAAFVVCPEINNNIMFSKYGVPSTCANPIQVALHVV